MTGAYGLRAISNVRTLWFPVVFFIAFAMFGYAVAGQFRAVGQRADLENMSVSELTTLFGQVSTELGQTRLSYFELRARLADLEEKSRSQETLAEDLRKEVETLGAATGMLPVAGPGVRVTINFKRGALPATALVDLVNELRASQAEAIAVDGRRVTAWSSFTSRGGQLSLDGHELVGPVSVEAIGDPDTLAAALSMAGGMAEYLSSLAGVGVDVERVDGITLPAAPKRAFRYLRPAR